MAHRLARAGAALAATAVVMLPSAAFADGSHDHASPSVDPHGEHAEHDEFDGTGGADAHGQHDEGGAGTAHDQGVATDDDTHDDHSATTDDDAGHTDHGTQPDEVSPEVRNLVLSGFAGVNAAVIFGAWMVRRTGPDPDPRKRTPKAAQ